MRLATATVTAYFVVNKPAVSATLAYPYLRQISEKFRERAASLRCNILREHNRCYFA